jgi:hypothetical protein
MKKSSEKRQEAEIAEDATEQSLISALLSPSQYLARWYLAIGTIGLLLAIINLSGQVHPTYRISWAGLLTMEFTNAAFEMKSTAPAFVASDAVFMLMCGGLVALALKTINSQEDGLSGFFSSLVKNDLWVSLASTEIGGWYLTGAAWCILSGIVFYVYWGISYMTWIDPGVYVVTIALIASGMGMKRLSGLEEED